MERDPHLPRPIDDGRVAQAIVEYTGRRTGAVTYRGPSGRTYRFGAEPSHRRHYVLDEDLERFQRHVEFRVLPDTRIDPEAGRREALKVEITREVLGKVTNLLSREDAEKRRPSGTRGGRPPGGGFGAFLDCLMTCGRLEEFYGSAAEAYQAICDYSNRHRPPDLSIPPRERFASVRSDAKRKRERTGHCTWRGHPEPVPDELIHS